jgi:hypothetical protein
MLQNCIACSDLTLYFQESFFTGVGWEGRREHFAVNKGGHTQFFLLVRKSRIRKLLGSFRNHKSANFWGVLVRKTQSENLYWLIRISQIRKCPCGPSSQIANPQICIEKNSVSDPDPHWFASNVFFGLQKYILDNEMPCISKLSHKSSLNFETFEAYICEKKNYLIADLRKF